jgi:hypothetical protein
LRKVFEILVQSLDDKGWIDWTEGYIDGSFSDAKKGAKASTRRGAVKVPKEWLSLSAEEVFLSLALSTEPGRVKSCSPKAQLNQFQRRKSRKTFLETKSTTRALMPRDSKKDLGSN